MADFKKESGGYVASARCWTTKAGKIVADGHAEAWQLLAPFKGAVIAEKLGNALKLDTATIEAAPKKEKQAEARSQVVSPEEIAARQTRPEKEIQKR